MTKKRSPADARLPARPDDGAFVPPPSLGLHTKLGMLIAAQTAEMVPDRGVTKDVDGKLAAAFEALAGFEPKTPLEKMAAAQLFALHNAAMDQLHLGYANRLNEYGDKSIRTATKCVHAFVSLLDALDRHRGRADQRVTVEHVHIHAGGQAVVGVVTPGGSTIQSDQGHAIANSSQPALRREDEERDLLPTASHAERPLQNARGKKHRRAEGK